METKICIRCKQELEISCFGKKKDLKSGIANICKKCCLQQTQKYRDEHSDITNATAKKSREKRKEKIAEGNKKYYQNNKERCNTKSKIYRENNKDSISNKHKEKRNYINTELKTDCLKCGEKRRHIIQFHHIDPKTKSFEIGAEGSGRHMDLVKKEVNKCICLCSNCHDEFHYFYGSKQQKTPIEDIEKYLGFKLTK